MGVTERILCSEEGDFVTESRVHVVDLTVWDSRNPGIRTRVSATVAWFKSTPGHVSVDFANPFNDGNILSVTTLIHGVVSGGVSNTAAIHIKPQFPGVIIHMKNENVVMYIPRSVLTIIASFSTKQSEDVRRTPTKAQEKAVSALPSETEAWLHSLTKAQVMGYIGGAE